MRLRLVSIPHCNLPQDQLVLKCLKLNSTPCVQYGLVGKVNVSPTSSWGREHAVEYLSVAGGYIYIYIYILLICIHMSIIIFCTSSFYIINRRTGLFSTHFPQHMNHSDSSEREAAIACWCSCCARKKKKTRHFPQPFSCDTSHTHPIHCVRMRSIFITRVHVFVCVYIHTYTYT